MQYLTILAVVTTLLQNAVPQTIDPTTVDDVTKETWCNNQKASCPLLCLQEGASDVPASNDCTASTLVYSCICDNGLTPNASEYSQTVPFYECTEAATQCVNRCPKTDSACQSQCRTANPCGAQNPTRVNTTTSSTMAATATRGGAAATDASDSSYTGFGDAATTGSSESTNNAQALAIGFGRSWGLAVVFVGISAGFIFML
ncbi:MAG: hypothetical protein L6R38_006780 [Xanthoria sp. 2 TBL-2021]|nr:MAG: hypothetical protein L6R38_006780 [Xanthoria sp. 2 TBL-2021]